MLLKSMEDSTSQDHRLRKLITIYLLQAILETNRSHTEAARDRLQKALLLAEPQGYQRAFLDEGQVIIGLLPEVRDFAPDFVGELLGDTAPDRPTEQQPYQDYEPLSERSSKSCDW